MVKRATPRADAVRNRQRILAVAEATFASDGLGVPVDVIAARAAVGVGTLYRHFPTKEALLEAIVLGHLERSVGRARGHAAAADPTAAVLTLVTELVTAGAQRRDLVEALGASGFAFGSATARAKAALQRAIGKILARAQAQGGIRADLTPADLVALVRGVFASSGSDARARDRHLAVVLAGLRAP